MALEKLWYVFQCLGVLTLILVIATIFISMIYNLFSMAKKKQREEELNQLIKQAIQNNNYNLSILTDNKEEKNKKNK